MFQRVIIPPAERTAILTQHYFDGASNEELLQSLPISCKTYNIYKNDILCTAAFYAAKRGALQNSRGGELL